ncbi:MAG: hypothetical protein M1828_001857 [Chrysothrix sp. TS-e1954]|nr:MAG: hypothetical protein M1828_001857 [Chrysothrix sp. TS-e1954]
MAASKRTTTKATLKSKQPNTRASVTCSICFDDDLTAKDTIRLKQCGCIWCKNCIPRTFETSVSDKSRMPPKCCNNPILGTEVSRFVDRQLQRRWNDAWLEFTSANKLYCPRPDCGVWIPDGYKKNIWSDQLKGYRKIGSCSKCGQLACAKCGKKWHTSPACTDEKNEQLFKNMVQKFGWKECPFCKAVVAKTEGCNHMQCTCGKAFCARCGGVWSDVHECPVEMADISFAIDHDPNHPKEHVPTTETLEGIPHDWRTTPDIPRPGAPPTALTAGALQAHASGQNPVRPSGIQQGQQLVNRGQNVRPSAAAVARQKAAPNQPRRPRAGTGGQPAGKQQVALLADPLVMPEDQRIIFRQQILLRDQGLYSKEAVSHQRPGKRSG